MNERFSRTRLLLGDAAIERLARSRAVVAGLGAVGSYAAEALARAGVGALRIVDFDVVRPSNVNRQLYALGSTFGRWKAEVAAERIGDIHPRCHVEALRLFIDGHNADSLFEDRPGVAVDAIDSLNPKVALIAAARRHGVAVVSAMGAATRTDPLAIRVADLAQTEGCPLARLVRKRLRREGVTSGVRCVFSIEPARRGPAAPADPPSDDVAARPGRPRRALGSLPTVTGMFGLVAATEALRLLLGDLWPPPVPGSTSSRGGATVRQERTGA